MARSPNISGRFRSATGAQRLDLRVDLGRTAPHCLSGDLFDVPESGPRYAGSFIAKQLARLSATTISGTGIEGTGALAHLAGVPTVRVTVQLGPGTPGRPASARVEFLGPGDEPVTPEFVCGFVDRNFREVSWQLACIGDVEPFKAFDTKSKHGKMTVSRAFGRAGIKFKRSGAVQRISVPAGVDDIWTDAELHAAMQDHFRAWRNEPQWNVCVLVAPCHEDAGVDGIMFDQDDFPRQGCAVFSADVTWSNRGENRDQLFTYVHEIGHCFNIPHSWDREHGVPLLPQGPSGGSRELSWMNYPDRYVSAGGNRSARAYWRKFGFQFTPTEINHLRHAFRDDIIPGGNPFSGAGAGASAAVSEQAFHPRATDATNLKLELRCTRQFVPGEPVIVEAKLTLTGAGEHILRANLHPHRGKVRIGIRHAGELRLYRPPFVYCAGKVKPTKLNADRPSVYKSAYLGYGRGGLYFKEPGRYELAACYVAPDGSRVVTDPDRPLVLDIDWGSGEAALDREVASLLSGEQQGMLFWLGGSDELPVMAAGAAALRRLLQEEPYCRHPLTAYARCIEGVNLGRPFKRLTVDGRGRGRIIVRPAQPEISVRALSQFVDFFRDDLTFDNLTLNFGMRRLARSLRLAGKRKEADEVLDSILPTFVDRVARAKGEKKKDVERKIGNDIRVQMKKERARWRWLAPGTRNGGR